MTNNLPHALLDGGAHYGQTHKGNSAQMHNSENANAFIGVASTVFW